MSPGMFAKFNTATTGALTVLVAAMVGIGLLHQAPSILRCSCIHASFLHYHRGRAPLLAASMPRPARLPEHRHKEKALSNPHTDREFWRGKLGKSRRGEPRSTTMPTATSAERRALQVVNFKVRG